MALLYNLLFLIVLLGPIVLVSYALRYKLGLTEPVMTKHGPSRRGEIQWPPAWTFVVWVVSLVGLIFIWVKGF